MAAKYEIGENIEASIENGEKRENIGGVAAKMAK